MALMDSLRPALGPVDRMPSRRCGPGSFLELATVKRSQQEDLQLALKAQMTNHVEH